MTPSPRPPQSPARRASLLLLILGGCAALMGVAMIAFAPSVIAAQDPETRARLEELRKQIQIDPKIFFAIAGFILLAYGISAITLGVLVRGGGRATVIVTLVLAALVTLVMALQVVAVVLTGRLADAVVSVLILVAHGVLVRWMIQSLTGPGGVASPMVAPPPKPPLQDYYLPPMPPESA